MKQVWIIFALALLASPAVAQRVPNPLDKLPPEQQFLEYLKPQIKADIDIARISPNDQKLITIGKSYCQALRKGRTYSSLKSEIDSIKHPYNYLHQMILEQAMWSLCSDQMEKIRGEN